MTKESIKQDIENVTNCLSIEIITLKCKGSMGFTLNDLQNVDVIDKQYILKRLTEKLNNL